MTDMATSCLDGAPSCREGGACPCEVWLEISHNRQIMPSSAYTSYEMANPSLDTIDRRIVATLQEDGRRTNVDVADAVGLSPSPCLRRIKRLEAEGVIRRRQGEGE